MNADLIAQEPLYTGDRRVVHLLVAGRTDELGAGNPQRALARDDSFLRPDEPGHPGHDEQEEHCRGDDQNQDVWVLEGLEEADRRGDQAGAAQQRKPDPREPRAGVARLLLEHPHRGVQGGRAPEDVVHHPAEVVDQLSVVVGVLEDREVVRRVGRQQADDAPREEVERRRALAGVDREPDRGRKQKHVAERVGDRDALREPREPGEVDVGRDQEGPREQADADRQDQGVDQRGRIPARITPLDQHEQPGHEDRVDEQVERVSRRRERGVRVAVRVDVAAEEEELADREEQPRRSCPRLVHPNARDDRHDSGETDGVE